MFPLAFPQRGKQTAKPQAEVVPSGAGHGPCSFGYGRSGQALASGKAENIGVGRGHRPHGTA